MTPCIMPPEILHHVAGNHRAVVNLTRQAIALSALFMSLAAGADATANDTDSAAHMEKRAALRRVFVPADNVGAWPTGGDKFLPIESFELEGLIAKVNQQELRTSDYVVVQGQYSARLQDDRLVGGNGRWQIELTGQGPAFLPLSNLSIIITNPRWHDEPDRSALVGAWGADNSPAVDAGLDVAQSGTFDFDWSAPLRAVQNGAELQWSLPPALRANLTLDLPVGKTPAIDGGVVLSSNPIPAGKAAGGAVYRRWVLALSPQPTARLRIVDTHLADADAAQPQRSLSETLAYRITERGLEITAKLAINEWASPLRELVVPLPDNVQLISAGVNEQELSWHVVPGDGGRDSAAVVSLPAYSETPITVTLSAWQPLMLNRAWDLPRLQPPGMFWTSGDIEVAVSPALEVQQLTPTGCVQSGVMPRVGDNQFEGHTFTAFEDDAKLEVLIAKRPTEASARLTSTLALAEADITGQLVSEISVERGSLHTLVGELAEGWLPEAIETDPAEALGEWFLDEGGGRTSIEVQLAHATTSQRPVTIKVTGRLQRSVLSGPVPLETLRMVHWRDMNVSRHLLNVETLEPYDIEPIGDMPEISRISLTTRELAMLQPTFSNAPIYDLSKAAFDASLRVLERPRFSAEVILDLACESGNRRATYHVVGRPSSSRLDRLVVYFTQPLEATPRWNEDSSGAPLVAERLAPDDSRRANLIGGEAWLVRLARPTAGAVHVVCALPPASITPKPVPLVAVPTADSQQGRVLVRTTLDRLPAIEQKGLIPIPFATTNANRDDEVDTQSPIRAAYRYEPARCQDALDAPSLRIGSMSARGISPVVVRHIDMESFYPPAGDAHHQATYQVEYYATNEFSLPLPDGAKLSTVSVNGLALASSATSSADDAHFVALPKSATFATIVATFQTIQRPIMAGSQLASPLEENVAPICDVQWTIWLPKGYGVTGRLVTPTDDALTWRDRLFGPLAQPRNDRPIHPLSIKDWQRLAGPFARSLDDSRSGAAYSELRFNESAALRQASLAVPDSMIWGSSMPAFGAIHLGALNEVLRQSMLAPQSNGANWQRLAGWHAYRAALVAGQPATVTVAHRPLSISWAAAALLLGLALGGPIWIARREAFVIALAIVAACAFLLPSAFALVATGGFLGLLLSLLARSRLHAVDDESPTRTWQMPGQLSALALLFVLSCPSPLLSQPHDPAVDAPSESSEKENRHESRPSGDDKSPDDDNRPVHSVFIPVDGEGRPVGSKHYVSEQFLRELMKAAQIASERRWVLLAANYVGELREAEPAAVVPGNFSLFVTIEVLARDTKVVLPLAREEAEWSATGTLDGIPVPIAWAEDGRHCVVAIAEPGRYQLALSCVPRKENVAGRDQFALTVPPVPGATVRLQHPNALSDIHVTDATVIRRANESPGALLAELHGTNKLRIDWPGRAQEARDEGPRVTELHWVRAGHNTIEVETKWLLEGSDPWPESLTVSFDDRWELVDGGTPVEFQEGGAAGTKSVGIRLASDASNGHEVSLRWRWTEGSPFGNLYLPIISVSPLPVTQRWVAVSSAPELSCQMIDATAAAATANEFLALWGDPGDGPATPTVLANVESESRFLLAVRPRSMESSIDERLDVAAAADGLKLHYEADVEASGMHEYQFPLEVSENLIVEAISLLQAEQPIPLRWSRPSAGSLNVFFSQRVAGEYRVEVSARVVANSFGSYVVPYIGPVGATGAKRVQLFREVPVLAELRGLSEVDSRDDSIVTAPTSRWTARPLAAYQFDRETFERARLVVRPNNVQTSGQTLLTLSREPDGWWASYTCELTVDRGILDLLTLRVPSTWSGPFEVESDVRNSVQVEAIGNGHNRLFVRLAESLTAGNTLQMQIRARVSSGSAGAITVPQVVLETPMRGRHLVLVPSMLEARPIFWTQSGVRRAPLPRGFRPPEQVAAIWQLFEVVRSPFLIAQRMNVGGPPAGTVRLADTVASAGPRGNRFVVTRMVIVARNFTECTLEIPSEHELVSVSLDGRPALIRQLEGLRWQLSLGPPQMPQWLEIVTRSSANHPPSGRRIELARPRLVLDGADVPVEISLWALNSPWSTDQPRTKGADLVVARDQAALRLDRLVSIVESALPAALESPPPDGYHWYRPWRDRLMALRQAAWASAHQAPPADGPAQVASAADEQLTAASERLDAWIAQCDAAFERPADAASMEGPARDATTTLRSASSMSGHWIYCVAEGGDPRLVIELDQSIQRSGITQLAGLLMIIGLAAAGIALVRHPAASDVVCRWPHALITIGGIAYWAWLWPSWLGAFIALAGIVTSLLPTTSGRTIFGDESTVLRRGRSV